MNIYPKVAEQGNAVIAQLKTLRGGMPGFESLASDSMAGKRVADYREEAKLLLQLADLIEKAAGPLFVELSHAAADDHLSIDFRARPGAKFTLKALPMLAKHPVYEESGTVGPGGMFHVAQWFESLNEEAEYEVFLELTDGDEKHNVRSWGMFVIPQPVVEVQIQPAPLRDPMDPGGNLGSGEAIVAAAAEAEARKKTDQAASDGDNGSEPEEAPAEGSTAEAEETAAAGD